MDVYDNSNDAEVLNSLAVTNNYFKELKHMIRL
jgi:hypothetical protein